MRNTGTMFDNSPLAVQVFIVRNLTFLDCHELFCGGCATAGTHLMAKHSSEESNNGARDAEQYEQ